MKGRVAVVTGASRGIGREVALGLARRGLDVALLARSSDGLARVRDEVTALGQRALAVRCDVALAADVSAATMRVIAELGAPEVVVANAGIVRRAPVAVMSEADWDAVIAVNLKGAFLLARALVPAMTERGHGRYVAIGSISSTLGTAGQSAYCASKWGVVGFVKSLAEEVRGTGVQALSVLPGSVDTDMLKGSGFEAKMTAMDVAGLVVYAALDAPDAMNGSALEMFGP